MLSHTIRGLTLYHIVRAVLVVLLLVACLGPAVKADDSAKVAHVYVALCDNVNQGIVPVPSTLGNGQDARNNLYWGALYGVKTYFDRSADWVLQAEIKNPASSILERCVFRSAAGNAYLVADAYDGAKIKQAIMDFLLAAAGSSLDSISVGDRVIGVGGHSQLLAYIGHNGLMDFRLDSLPASADSVERDVVILACVSKAYFEEAIRRAGANPLLWTTGLMAPEAYTLAAAIEARFGGAKAEDVRTKAAEAYDKYQKCGLRAAKRLLVTSDR